MWLPNGVWNPSEDMELKKNTLGEDWGTWIKYGTLGQNICFSIGWLTVTCTTLIQDMSNRGHRVCNILELSTVVKVILQM